HRTEAIVDALVDVDEPFQPVAQSPQLPPLGVLAGIPRGLPHQAVDLVAGRTAGRVDLHALALVGGEIARRDIDDAARVDGEGDLDLGHAAGRAGDADEREAAGRLVFRR